MKNYVVFSLLFLFLVVLSCHNPSKSQVVVDNKTSTKDSCDQDLNSLNQGNIFKIYFNNLKDPILFDFRAVYSCTKRIQVSDSVFDENCGDSVVQNLPANFTRCNGLTKISIDGKNIFRGTWHGPYGANYLEKTMVQIGASHDYAFVKIKLDRLFILRFNPDTSYEFNLNPLCDSGYEHSFYLVDLVHYKGDIFIMNIRNGWIATPGPQRLVAVNLKTGCFKKFLFK